MKARFSLRKRLRRKLAVPYQLTSGEFIYQRLTFPHLMDTLQWQSFWEQFKLHVHVYVHNRTKIFDAAKLEYLKDALIAGPTYMYDVIHRLAQTAENYSEAVSCL